ncbi:hypothetical protein AYI68_g6768, partial [Smittium mucronatum]
MMGKVVVVSNVPNPESWQLKKANKLADSYEYVVNDLLSVTFADKKNVVLGPRCDLSNF